MTIDGRNPLQALRRVSAALLIVFGLVSTAGSGAQPVHPGSAPLPSAARPAPATESGLGWQGLTAPQREDLRPLEREWASLDLQQKRKWLELTGRMPKMSLDERTRIQARMIDWAKLTPQQRSEARLRYQETRRVPLPDRQARWDAYQSLPFERKQQLAERALIADAATRRPAGRERPAREAASGPKSSSAGVLDVAVRRTPVSPALVQARPGATTTSIARLPAPPAHQQVGMPKIAATPDFVDKSTLLPRRGPQAAARAQASASGVAP